MAHAENSDGAALLSAAREAYKSQKLDAAIAGFRQALASGADPVAAHNDLGLALKANGRHGAAIAHYRRSLALAPDSPEVWLNLAIALSIAGRGPEALEAARQAAALDPDKSLTQHGAGIVARANGEIAEALVYFDRARSIRPDDAVIAFERGVTLLTLGRLREGFAEYEHRRRTGRALTPDFPSPEWRGEPLDGQDILIHAEQGLGDMLQFVRLAPSVRERTTGRVYLECPQPLRRLFDAIDPAIEVIPAGGPPVPHDLHVSIMSLPYVLNLGPGEEAGRTPYLRAPSPERMASLAKRPANRPRAALTWRGNQNNPRRSCPFDVFMAILETPDVDFFSFQRGDAQADIQKHGAEDLVIDLAGDLHDFADDANALASFDIVITIDTAFCHLAAALGKPTWTLLPFAADWRFGTDAEQCPWHPTMRLFRQTQPGDWRQPIAAVCKALEGFVEDWRSRREAADKGAAE